MRCRSLLHPLFQKACFGLLLTSFASSLAATEVLEAVPSDEVSSAPVIQLDTRQQWMQDHATFRERMIRAIRAGKPQSPAEAEALHAQFLRDNFTEFVLLEERSLALRDAPKAKQPTINAAGRAHLETLESEVESAATPAAKRLAEAQLRSSRMLLELEARQTATTERPEG